ncbi:uncharacterized protein [Arachis hypogaea]|uniref:uncharacterized protein n=1 Tax=Arachis hypogaea TaxID=3818 RepID=UPI003B227972
MSEVHEGVYGSHIGGQSLAAKILRASEIVSDNGWQFTNTNISIFLLNFNIKHHFNSIEHPQINGQAEEANRIMLQALRKKFADAKGQCAKLIPEILWSYNTTVHSTIGETPFRLVYGTEAMIPVEIAHSLLRTELYDNHRNMKVRSPELDLL